MLFAVVLFAFGGRINAFVAARAGVGRGAEVRQAPLRCMRCSPASALYGGFFNAGLGVLLLAFLDVGGHHQHPRRQRPQALRSRRSWRWSPASRASRSPGAIDWYHGAVALVGVTIGGYGAARLAKLIPTADHPRAW